MDRTAVRADEQEMAKTLSCPLIVLFVVGDADVLSLSTGGED